MTPYPPSEQARFVQAGDAFRGRAGGTFAAWQDDALPRIVQAYRSLCVERDARVARLAETASCGRGLTFVAGAANPLPLVARLTAFLADAFGSEGERLVHNLRQGGANATLDVDQALWELAKLARAQPAVRRPRSRAGACSDGTMKHSY